MMLRLASVADTVNCHSGSPNRSASSAAAAAASAVGSMKVAPRSSCASIAATGRCRRMPAHRAGVAEAEVDEVDPVLALEMGTACSAHVERPWTRPLLHPQHRDAAWEVLASSLPHRPARRMARCETCDLGLRERRDAHDFASRFLRAAEVSWLAITSTIAKMNTADPITLASGGMPFAAAV